MNSTEKNRHCCGVGRLEKSKCHKFSDEPRSPQTSERSNLFVEPLSTATDSRLQSRISCSLNIGKRGFPGGAVVENLPANAGDTGSSPGLGRSHMPRSN